MAYFDTWAIYNPAHDPDTWLVLRWRIEDGRLTPGSPRVASTLDDARRLIEYRSILVPMLPADDDDPDLVETWI
jgi:hypothetical protein